MQSDVQEKTPAKIAAVHTDDRMKILHNIISRWKERQTVENYIIAGVSYTKKNY